MKKIILSLSLVAFLGTVSVSSYAQEGEKSTTTKTCAKKKKCCKKTCAKKTNTENQTSPK